MKTKLLHRLRVKLFTDTCTPDNYKKVKKIVFKKCDRLIREYILKELEKFR